MFLFKEFNTKKKKKKKKKKKQQPPLPWPGFILATVDVLENCCKGMSSPVSPDTVRVGPIQRESARV